jgi:lysophospholipase L1-like esterase
MTPAMKLLMLMGGLPNPAQASPLLTSLLLSRGIGSATFTRASAANNVDFEGVTKSVAANNARFRGARMVTNQALHSADFSHADWSVFNGCAKVGAGPVSPLGNTSTEVSFGATATAQISQSGATLGTIAGGFYVRAASGTTTVRATAWNLISEDITLTTDWRWISHRRTFAGGGGGLCGVMNNAAGTSGNIYVAFGKIEDVTGQSNLNVAAENITTTTATVLNHYSVLNSKLSISGWGDSLTYGDGSTGAWPYMLSAAIGGFIVNNYGISGDTSAQVLTRFQALPSSYGDVTVIWFGYNDIIHGTGTPTQIKANIASIVAALTTSKFVVLGVTNGTAADLYSSEELAVGGVGYDLITTLNSDLAALYPDNFYDVRAALVAAYDPEVPQDVLDYANDIVPGSLRSDYIHLTSAGYAVVADGVYDFLTAKNWIDDTSASAISTPAGYLSEGARTQYLGATATPATQTTASLGTGTYTLSVVGSGSALASGGTATISGAASATAGSPNTFTVTVAGTVTVTKTGALTRFQLENGAFESSYITNAEAAGTTAARVADVLSIPTAGNVLAAAGAVFMEFTPRHAPSGTIALWGSYVDADNYTALLHDATNLIMRKRIAGVNYDATIALAFEADTTYKVAGSWGPVGVKVFAGGVKGTDHANVTAAQIAATMQIGADGNSLQQPFANLRNESTYTTQVADAYFIRRTA